MIRILWAMAGAAAMLLLEISSSQALVGEAPWCAVLEVGTGEMYWDCEYQTAAQCAPNVVAGNRGFCNVNPYYKPGVAAAPAATRHYSRHKRPPAQ